MEQPPPHKQTQNISHISASTHSPILLLESDRQHSISSEWIGCDAVCEMNATYQTILK